MPVTPAACPLDCPDACGVLIESDDQGRFVGLKGNPAHGYSRGTLCSKTAAYGDLLRSPERLLTPLLRRNGKRSPLEPANWDEALAMIAARVRPLVPPQTSAWGRVLAAWYAGSMGLVQRNLPLRLMNALGAVQTDGGLCDHSASAGYECVMGRVVGFDLERADECDFVLVWGCDVARTHQHLLPTLQRLCKAGVGVVALDVYRSETIRALERWGGRGLVLHPGTDAALALGMAHLAFERRWADHGFLARETRGFAEFERHVRGGHDLEWTARVTGLPAREIETLTRELASARRPLIKTGVGFARRRVGAMSMRAVCSLAAVLGKVDALHYESFDCFRLDIRALQRPELHPAGQPAPTIRHVELGRELQSGRFGALFVWGHNPAVTCPDSSRVRAGLEREDLFAVVHDQFLTETAERADVVLPATCFPEHADVYRSYGHRRMQVAKRAVQAPPGPQSNVLAFRAIARALGLEQVYGHESEQDLCELVLESNRERIGPRALAELRRGEPAKIDPPAIEGWGTPSGKLELWSAAALSAGQPPMASYVPDDACGEAALPYWLVCAPSRATHNSTYSHSPRHVARMGPPCVHVARADFERLALVEGQRVRLCNARGRLTLPARPSDDLPGGMLRIDGLPRAKDLPEGVGVNTLVSDSVSDLGEGNVLYSTRVELQALEETRAQAHIR